MGTGGWTVVWQRAGGAPCATRRGCTRAECSRPHTGAMLRRDRWRWAYGGVMNLRDLPLTTIDGASTSLADYASQVVLVVNVASKCGSTPQYEQLEELQQRHGPRRLRVLGFPFNQFLGQEPGSEAELQEFRPVSYGTPFPPMAQV